jgi:hypothetical protein
MIAPGTGPQQVQDYRTVCESLLWNHFGLTADDATDLLGDDMDISVDLLFVLPAYERVNQLAEKHDLLRIDSVDQDPLTVSHEKSITVLRGKITPMAELSLF